MAQPRKKPGGVRRKAAVPAKSRARSPQEPLVDPRIRPLLERYVAAVGAELTEIAEGAVELRLPAAERKWFQDRSSLRIAFTLDALESDPEAEIAVVGSTLVEQLIAAIRARGSRLSYGQLTPQHEPDATAAELHVPITNGSAGKPHVDVGWHRIVRLIARVVVRSGGEVEEHLLESEFFDAMTGVTVPAEMAERCVARGAWREARAGLRAEESAAPESRAQRSSLATRHARASVTHAPRVTRRASPAWRPAPLPRSSRLAWQRCSDRSSPRLRGSVSRLRRSFRKSSNGSMDITRPC